MMSHERWKTLTYLSAHVKISSKKIILVCIPLFGSQRLIGILVMVSSKWEFPLWKISALIIIFEFENFKIKISKTRSGFTYGQAPTI
jgi:hypothetical protein